MGCSWLNGRKGERWKTGRKCRKELQAPHGARFGSTARSCSAQIPLTHQLPLIGIPAHPSEEEAGSPCDLSVAARWVSHTGPEAEQCAPTQKIFAWAGKCLRLNFEFFFEIQKIHVSMFAFYLGKAWFQFYWPALTKAGWGDPTSLLSANYQYWLTAHQKTRVRVGATTTWGWDLWQNSQEIWSLFLSPFW